MSKSASVKAIKRPLKRNTTQVAQEDGIIEGQIFTDEDVVTGRLVDETGALYSTIPSMMGISIGDELVPRPIAGVFAVEDLPTSLEGGMTDEEEDFTLPGEIEIAGPDDDDETDASFAGAMDMAGDTQPAIISTLTEEGRTLAEQAGDVAEQLQAAGIAVPEVSSEMTEEEQEEDAELEAEVDDETRQRKELMHEITELVTICGYMQNHIDRAQFMTLSELKEYVHTLRINSGGSVGVARLLAETEEDFHKFVASEEVQRKIALVEAKGSDFINVAQQISRVLGSDVVINGVRFAEYREMLRILTEHTSIVQRGITEFADILRIEVPERLDLGGKTMPVVEGMPINTKTTLYILNVILNNIRSWRASSAQADELMKRYKNEAEAAKKALERQVEENKALHQRVESIRKEYNQRMSDVNSWILKHPKGFLAKKDIDEPLSFKNLTFVEVLEDAIHLKSRIAADDLAQRVLERKPKFSDHTEYTVLPVIVAK